MEPVVRLEHQVDREAQLADAGAHRRHLDAEADPGERVQRAGAERGAVLEQKLAAALVLQTKAEIERSLAGAADRDRDVAEGAEPADDDEVAFCLGAVAHRVEHDFVIKHPVQVRR